MKKVRVMLMSIVVLAAVGGALAFKAKTFGVSFCTDPEQRPQVAGIKTNAHDFCTELIQTTTTDLPNISTYYATPTVLDVCEFEAAEECTASFLTNE